MLAPATLRFVVAVEIAGTAHLVVTARDAGAAIEAAFATVRRSHVADWWPRRQADDFIAPHAKAYATGGSAFEVGLPIVGTAYVTLDAADAVEAVARAYVQVAEEDIDDWRPVREAIALHPPSVALETDTEE